MPVIHAIYEHGVFRPTEPVELPDGCSVDVMYPDLAGSNESDTAFPNERRVQLIRKQFEAGLSDAESQELQDLQDQSLQLLEKWDAALLANVDHMQAAIDEVVHPQDNFLKFQLDETNKTLDSPSEGAEKIKT